ncbi:sodium-dependent dicarboxylate transporter 2/3/5 [Flavobacterium arsenatis]|uniref:Sodium-dependent dicarboxylate transporter 2/3/5 n=1 Tax=Flavobacterium arsenatis TaxID=1484332 RepID=A0ABU1TTS8_9FLAO|nr:SLC13 family permease [Flavobacterium arsenatis]MDR6969289.1 sodium-dependent dicarboxylate transporter 2/3/5 [Flavobacterium arsenatis]
MNIPLDENIKTIKIPALAIALLLFFVVLNYPLFQNHQAQKALALLILVAVLWMTEAIPLALTGLMIPVVAVFLHLVPTDDAFDEFAHPIIFLFMGGFVLAGALTRYGLDMILAQKLIHLAKGNFYKSAILLMLATSIAACWVSNTAATAMMIPLGLGLLGLLQMKVITAESKFLILGIAYSANIGGVITIIASPPNAIGAAVLGLSFSEWIKYSLPVFLISFPLMVIALTLYFKPDRKMLIGEILATKHKSPPKKTLIIIIFIFTVLLWVLESVLSPLLKITNSFSSLVAVVAIFLIYCFGVLNWKEIIKTVDWEVLLLFGGGLTLGMLIDKSGLGIVLVSQVAQLINILPFFLFLWIIVLFSIILTEFMSNTASAALILPLLFTLANQLGVNPMVLVFPATIAASYGFMLPAGTPPNAMAFATGLIPQKDMIKIGLLLNLGFSILLTFFFYLIFK